jgi:hypothetical protein
MPRTRRIAISTATAAQRIERRAVTLLATLPRGTPGYDYACTMLLGVMGLAGIVGGQLAVEPALVATR